MRNKPKVPKMPPPEIVPGRLLYVGKWCGHEIYRDSMSDNRCKYVCLANGVWYRSPSIRDLLAIPLDRVPNPTRRDQVLFCLSAIDRLLLDLSDIKPQLRNLLLQFKIILNELKDENDK